MRLVLRHVVVYFLFIFSLQAGYVELKNGSFIEGIAQEKGNEILLNDKKLSWPRQNRSKWWYVEV